VSHVPTQFVESAELTRLESAELSGILVFQKNCRSDVSSFDQASANQESGCLAEVSGLDEQFQHPAQALDICNDK
jgi:hypothetical protein